VPSPKPSGSVVFFQADDEHIRFADCDSVSTWKMMMNQEHSPLPL
jgi:hypothetical protein